MLPRRLAGRQPPLQPGPVPNADMLPPVRSARRLLAADAAARRASQRPEEDAGAAGGDPCAASTPRAAAADAAAAAEAALLEATFACASASGRAEAPPELCCPLTLDVFRDPVVAPSGQSYERSALLEHLAKVGPFDPITRARLAPGMLVGNVQLRQVAARWLDEHPWALGELCGACAGGREGEGGDGIEGLPAHRPPGSAALEEGAADEAALLTSHHCLAVGGREEAAASLTS